MLDNAARKIQAKSAPPNAGTEHLDRSEFGSQTARIERKGELHDRLNAHFRSKTTDEWITLLREAGVPAAPILDSSEVVSDPYVREISTKLDVESGDHTWQRFPVRFSGFAPRLENPPRRSGADTETVLREHGFAPERIRALREAGVIQGTSPGVPMTVLGYATLAEARRALKWSDRWKAFDGNADEFNLAHECLGRYVLRGKGVETGARIRALRWPCRTVHVR